MQHPLIVPQLDGQRLLGGLKATGSSDPDILYARKEELLQDTRSRRMYATPAIILGLLMSLTVILAPLGIPLALLGWWNRTKSKRNIETAEAVFTDYVTSVGARAPAGT
jgi:hypothetical protein